MGKEFTMNRLVQFCETDLAGILHFSNYYRLMEEIECAFWRAQGMSVIGPPGDQGVSWPRVFCSCEYFAPARFEDELEIGLKVAELGERSVTYEIEFRSRGERIARGRVKGVCCRTEGGSFRPVAIPDEYREKLASIHSG
jgi:acyl-CoA thioester hydrolase